MTRLRALLLTTAIVAAFLGLAATRTSYPSIVATTCTNQFIRSIAAATGVGTCATVVASTDITGLGGYATISAGAINNVLSGDVSLNNTGTFFDGPSIAQGSTGTWFVVGTVTVTDTVGIANFDVKLWDGTTVLATSRIQGAGANACVAVTLAGYLATPAGNLRISVKDASLTTGKISAGSATCSGQAKESTITAIRIN